MPSPHPSHALPSTAPRVYFEGEMLGSQAVQISVGIRDEFPAFNHMVRGVRGTKLSPCIL